MNPFSRTDFQSRVFASYGRISRSHIALIFRIRMDKAPPLRLPPRHEKPPRP